MTGRVRFCVLGRLTVEGDSGGQQGPGGRRGELVFAYLAVEHRRLVTRDELADALWPDLLPDTWAAALRGVVSDVRRYLDGAGLDGGSVLERSQRGYRFRLPGDAVLDVDEAEAAAEEARALLDADPPRAADRARRAAELAGLPFLPEHEGAWVDGVRRRIGSLHVAALELEARALARAGDHRGAADAAERLVLADPFAEPAHQLRIGLLTAAGDRAGALRAYDECRRVLAEELGVAPSAATEAARRHAFEQPAPAPAPTAPYAGWSVLVVEDHDFQRRTAVALLRSLGMEAVTEASDGAEALTLLGTSAPPDVIVCDVDMPGMDGVEFLRHVAARRLSSAVVIVSGIERSVLDGVGAVTEGHGLQVLGVVEKPLTARVLAGLFDRYRPARSTAGDGPVDAGAGEVVEALEGGGVRFTFAPIVDLAEGRVGGAAAGAVWRDPVRGAVPAARFLPVLDAAGRSAAFTGHLVERACAELVELAADKRDVRLWLPLADGELADPALADRVVAPLRHQDLDPSAIVWVAGVGAVRRRRPDEMGSLIRLRLKGFGLALGGLGDQPDLPPVAARLPITALRFERPPGGAPDALERALDLARRLGVRAVVPGGLTAEDFDLLVSLGCPLAEGLPGHEAPVGAVAAMAATWEPPPRRP
ncbi:MAG TPA: EAL domain-containing protein [Acidimicrobiales bacterium]|nr:EAL domain-containing protein [Acidimicrobiales bacterium]